MKIDRLPQKAAVVTMQTVLDRLSENPGLTPSRKRDLRSAVMSFAKLMDQPPAAVPLDLASIRKRLDLVEPASAKISRKRWANIRSDLVAAIDASELRPMLKTAQIELGDSWKRLLAECEPRIARGLSRFARWASLRRIAPQAVDTKTIQRFVAELGDATLVRKLRYVRSFVSKRWNELVASKQCRGLRPVCLEDTARVLKRTPWQALPAALQHDVERYLEWGSMQDPLVEGARPRALGPRTLRLQQQHIHSAASAAVAAGIPVEELTSLAVLVQPDTFRAVLRQLWQQDGRKLSAYTHGIAITLIAIAAEWVKTPAEAVATLKPLRKKLGTLPSGLTDKNQSVLRTFEDPRLVAAFMNLPDQLWRRARRLNSGYAFVALQTALAIDILTHAPERMHNLSAIRFDTHLHWPQGPRKPALLTFRRQEVKNDVDLKRELPAYLADRLLAYRNEIAPRVIGRKPDRLFVTDKGKPRSQATIAIQIRKTIQRYLGVKVTPHQLRHLSAKITLDRNPGAYELVRQMLGHTSQKTTVNFYAGIDTLRAGRAHAALVNELRETNLGRGRRGQRLPRSGA
jgi:integrase